MEAEGKTDRAKGEVKDTARRVLGVIMSIGTETDPRSAFKRGPLLSLFSACPGSEQEGPARDAER